MIPLPSDQGCLDAAEARGQILDAAEAVCNRIIYQARETRDRPLGECWSHETVMRASELLERLAGICIAFRELAQNANCLTPDNKELVERILSRANACVAPLPTRGS